MASEAENATAHKVIAKLFDLPVRDMGGGLRIVSLGFSYLPVEERDVIVRAVREFVRDEPAALDEAQDQVLRLRGMLRRIYPVLAAVAAGGSCMIAAGDLMRDVAREIGNQANTDRGPETWDLELVKRRFGPGFEKPCKRHNVVSCARWQCQQANECQDGRDQHV